MSEPKVFKCLLDRVTAERDAALGREVALARDVANWKRKACESADREAALQVLLTAADERVDVLEGLLREHANHVATLADALFRSGACMTKEFSDLTYAALEQQQAVNAALKPVGGLGDTARIALRPENQRITPARFKCLPCGEYHEGSGNLPCPSMSPYSRIEQ